MRYSWLAVGILMLASSVWPQQEPQAQPEPQPQSKAEQSQSVEQPVAKLSDNGPAVDAAKVTGSTFESAFFKFTYELPKDWKALDDAVRVAANREYLEQDQEQASAHVTVPKKKSVEGKPPAKPSALPVPKQPPLGRYGLMVASPEEVSSLASPVLPRINIWAHQRAPSDDISDHVRFMLGTRRAQIIAPGREVSLDGHKFARGDMIAPGGEYRSEFVTAIGDYMVGFDLWATSQRELDLLTATMQTVKFK